MLCFAYCEWLDRDALKQALPDARFIVKATLPGFRLAFSSFTEDLSDEVLEGGCDLEEAPSEVVLGLLYDISEQDLLRADTAGRVRKGRYTRREFGVLDEDGTRYRAIAYVLKNPVGPSKPSASYLAHMIKGANEFNFPERYIELLRQWEH